MMQIIVALIGALGSIVAALIARKREDSRSAPKKEPSPRPGMVFPTPLTPRPKLVFASIFAVGMALTGVVVALLPRHVETTFEPRSPNVQYQERETGFVFALAEADGTNRSVAIDGFIGDERVTSAGAQDATVPGVPSIGASSFVMPVPKAQRWHIEVRATNPNPKVKVRWCAIRSDSN